MPTLHLLCGKIAAGKSTLAKALVAEHAAILLVKTLGSLSCTPVKFCR